MNPYDLTPATALADLNVLTAADTNELLNHTLLGTAAGGNVLEAAGAAVMAELDLLPLADLQELYVTTWGDVVTLRALFKIAWGTGWETAIPDTGNVADYPVLTIRNPAWRPQLVVGGCDGGGAQRAGFYHMTPAGSVVLGHVGGTAPVELGTIMCCSFTYIRRGL